MLRKPVRLLILLGLAGALAGAGFAAQGTPAGLADLQQPPPFCFDNAIDISPGLPGPGDPITIRPSGLWCSSCTPEYAALRMDGDTLRIDATSQDFEAGVACLTVITPWAFTVAAGPLPAGIYTVEMYIQKQFHLARTFTVGAAVRARLFFPVIAQGLDGSAGNP